MASDRFLIAVLISAFLGMASSTALAGQEPSNVLSTRGAVASAQVERVTCVRQHTTCFFSWLARPRDASTGCVPRFTAADSAPLVLGIGY
jgi:hypothetical protein